MSYAIPVTGIPGPPGGVDSVNGFTGIVVLVKADVGLGNVDNTSDVNKPVSTAQATAIAAITPMTTDGDMLSVAAGVKARVPGGSAGQILKYVSSFPTWEDRGSMSKETILEEDWFGTHIGQLGWIESSTGTASVTATDLTLVDSTHQGIVKCEAGTTAAAQAGIALGGNTATFTTGYKVAGGVISQEWLVRIGTLSALANDYSMHVGSLDTFAGLANGIYFWYDRLNLGGNWQARTTSASTNTTTDTAVAVVAGAWIKLRTEVNAAGTSVGFYINDVLVATNVTNIPSVAIAPTARLLKSSGTGGGSNRPFFLDYFRQYQRFTTAR